jgi:hypothetical protein
LSKLTQQQIEEWIATQTTGTFDFKNIMDGQIGKELLPQLRVIMHRLKEKGLAYPVDGKDGFWRAADKSLEEIAWWTSEDTISENLLLPMGLNKYCYIPLPSIILVAGKYNAGKTAFLMNVVNLNLEKWSGKIDYFVSEGADMMGMKLRNITPAIPIPPPFKTYRRTQNFADVIGKDSLSIIDYLRVDMGQPYAISNKIFEIFNKLDKGIAVIAMQKPPGDRKLAFGGVSTAFEPSLYIGMDNGWLGFEKIKIPKLLDINPYAVKIQFKIEKGVNFVDVHEVIENNLETEV